MKGIIFAIAITSLFMASPALAHGGESHSDNGQKRAVMPVQVVPVQESLATLEKGYARLQEETASGEFNNIHGTVEDMAAAFKLLSDSRKKDETVMDIAKQLERSWRELHDAGDAQDKSRVQTELRNLSTNLEILATHMQQVEEQAKH